MPFDMMRRKSPSDTMPEKNFSLQEVMLLCGKPARRTVMGPPAKNRWPLARRH